MPVKEPVIDANGRLGQAVAELVLRIRNWYPLARLSIHQTDDQPSETWILVRTEDGTNPERIVASLAEEVMRLQTTEKLPVRVLPVSGVPIRRSPRTRRSRGSSVIVTGHTDQIGSAR